MSSIVIERLLELITGLITFVLFRQKNNTGLSMRELLKEIEEKDREIERLKIRCHTWQIRYEHEKGLHT